MKSKFYLVLFVCLLVTFGLCTVRSYSQNAHHEGTMNVVIPSPDDAVDQDLLNIVKQRITKGYYNTHMMDGYYWMTLTPNEKPILVSGFMIGISSAKKLLASKNEQNNKILSQLLTDKIRKTLRVYESDKQIIARIDYYYSNNTNLNNTIFTALSSTAVTNPK